MPVAHLPTSSTENWQLFILHLIEFCFTFFCEAHPSSMVFVHVQFNPNANKFPNIPTWQSNLYFLDLTNSLSLVLNKTRISENPIRKLMDLTPSLYLVQLYSRWIREPVIFSYDQNNTSEVPWTLVQCLVPISQALELYGEKVRLYSSPDYLPRRIPRCSQCLPSAPTD